MTYIKNAATPTLIQHGELDRRVPIPNAYELRQGLEDRGVPVEMVVYKGYGHGISEAEVAEGRDAAQPGLVRPLHLRRRQAGPDRAASAAEKEKGGEKRRLPNRGRRLLPRPMSGPRTGISAPSSSRSWRTCTT